MSDLRRAGIGDNGGPAWTPDELRGLETLDRAYWRWQFEWLLTRRWNQVEPKGDEWGIWNILAGRGFGKTRVGAETLGNWAVLNPDTRWLVSAPTFNDLRTVCFEGESGLLAVLPPELIANYNKGTLELTVNCLEGGTSLIKGISSEEPERFRGPQFHGGWLDELAAWKYLQAAWDMIAFGMRLGDNPRLITTTTPRPKPLITALYKNKLSVPVVTTHGSSRENFANLAPTFRRTLMQYEGTSLGKQEIDGIILDAEEGGVIKRSWFSLWPHDMPLPAFDEIVLSLDTAFTEETRDKKTGDADPTACTVWGVWTSNPIGNKGPKRISAMLLDCWDERLSFPQLLTALRRDLKVKYGGADQKPMFEPLEGPPNVEWAGRKVSTVIIENKGSGISLRQVIEAEGIYAYRYNPGNADKLTRLNLVSHIAAAGAVYLLESENMEKQPKSWYNDFLAQVCAYSGKGSTQHDDYVDSFSQALRYIADTWGINTLPVKKKDDRLEEDLPEDRPRRSNPYSR